MNRSDKITTPNSFGPEDGNDMFLRSIGANLHQYSLSIQATQTTHRLFATTVSQLKISNFSGETFKAFEVL
jgi:hypothetical protein